jgi:hypothetical protein
LPAGQGADELRLAGGGHGGLLSLLRDHRSLVVDAMRRTRLEAVTSLTILLVKLYFLW